MRHRVSNARCDAPFSPRRNRAHKINWRPWGAAAFAEATDLDRPIFLLLTTSWSRRCHLLDETTLSNRSVIRELNRSYIPIRVDSERRPDISRRYLLDGWPTVAVLVPGGEAVAIENFLKADRTLAFLKRFSALYRSRGREIRARAQRALCDSYALEFGARRAPSRGRNPDRRISSSRTALKDAAWVIGLLVNRHDPRSGGFGEKQSLPNPAAVELLLKASRKRRPELLEMAANILDKMAAGLYDPAEGGFHRYSPGSTWKSPSSEKLLGVNASLISNYLLAYRLTRNKEYLKIALRSIDFMEDRLSAGKSGPPGADRAFFASSIPAPGARAGLRANPRAGNAPLYRAFIGGFSSSSRGNQPADREGHLVDETIFVDWNCRMAGAYFDAFLVSREARYLERALRLLDFLWEKCFEPERGMAHYFADGEPALFGQLEDQAWAIQAFARAAAMTGDRGHIARAIEILDIATLNLYDRGCFFDAPIEFETAAPMRIRLRPTVGNSVMARALALLTAITDDRKYLEIAEEILIGIKPESSLSLHELAEYALSAFEISEYLARAPRRRAA